MKLHIPLLTTLIILTWGTGAGVAQVAEAPAAPVAAVAPVAPEPPMAVPQIAYATTFTDDAAIGGTFNPNRSLVILKDETTAKNLAETEEDLNVMARILEKATSGHEDRTGRAMGIFVHSGMQGAASAPRNLYVEGYGALFFLNVNYPLVNTTAKPAEGESKEDANSDWEEARRELSEPASQNFTINLNQVQVGGAPAEEYDADKVEKLKTDLIAALKNASHIRRLKSDENVTVVVTGRGAGAESRTVSRRNARGHSTMAVVGRSIGESAGARLILRVRKSEVEALQKDKTSLEDFRKKVALMVY